jgi:hypothetical protein
MSAHIVFKPGLLVKYCSQTLMFWLHVPCNLSLQLLSFLTTFLQKSIHKSVPVFTVQF